MADSPTLQVESLSDIASGLEFSDEGSLVAVNEEHRSKLTKQLKDLAQGLRPYARFIRWFFSTGSDRTIFPASDVKVAEWVDNALLDESKRNRRVGAKRFNCPPRSPIAAYRAGGV